MNEFEGQPFIMNFSDHTILEGEGEYERVKEIMENESYVGCDWMVRSEVTIDFPTNSCIFIVHFYQNREIYIVEYQSSSVSDVFYNSDIPCLSMWSQDKGWNCPQPHPDLIRDATEFWKHFWETGVLDSEYLDEKCGKRIVDYTDYIDEEDDE